MKVMAVAVSPDAVGTFEKDAVVRGDFVISPNVPTFVEQGFKSFDVDLWYGFFYPIKTPSPIVERLNKELSLVLNSPEIKEILSKAGLDASTSTPLELGQIATKDYAKWGALIKAKGIVFE